MRSIMFNMNMQAVEELLSLEFYRFKRYKVPIALALIVTDHRDFFSIADSMIRKTDLVQQIDKNLFAIIYSHTDVEGAGFAVDNILKKVTDEPESIKVAIGEADYRDASEHELVTRVFAQISES